MFRRSSCAQVHDSDTPIETLFQTVVQAREDLVVKRENMGTTALMRIYEVMDVKRRIGGKNTKAVLEYYSKVRMAKTSEPVTASFIDLASMLSSSCLNIPEVVSILMSLDEREVNPLDSPAKLREICILCEKKPQLQIWAFGMLADQWLMTDAKEKIPIRELKDGGEHYSLVKLALFKRQLRDHLWQEMDSTFNLWEAEIRADIRRLTTSLQSCRAELGYFSDKGKAYQPRGSWPGSADSYLIIFEVLVYDYVHDELLKQMLKNHRGMDDILQHKDIRPGRMG